MSRTRPETCASCARFPLRAAAENKGVAECEGYERPTEWNEHACVLYNPASDIKDRKQIVIQLTKQLQKQEK